MKKKIVHLISSLKIGGAEVWLIDLIAHLPTSLEHHVIYFHDGPNRLLLEKRGIKTYHIKGLLFSYDPLFILRVYRTLRFINPVLIHSSLWAANLMGRLCCWLLNIPLVCTVHLGMDSDGLIRTLLDRLLFYNRPSYVIAVSEVVAQTLAHKKWIQHEKVITIKNGVDFNRLDTAQEPTSIQWNADDVVIGMVGRFIERKNFPWLINQFAALKKQRLHIKLLVVGLGPQEQELRTLIERLNLSCSVSLVVGKQALPYYSYMQCFVQPSLQEGLSIALLEAMYFKCACLIACPSDKHDVIKHKENGLLFRLDDDSFIRACIEVIDHKDLQKQLGNAAHESVRSNFSVQAMAQQYYRIYQKSSPLL